MRPRAVNEQERLRGGHAPGHLSLDAIFLEDRFKTIALAILASVAGMFVLWYLQAVLKVVVIAGLLAILLEPLINLLSVPPDEPPACTRCLREAADGCSPRRRAPRQRPQDAMHGRKPHRAAF